MQGKRLFFMVLLRFDIEKSAVSRKRQSCIVMRHNDFDDGHLLHAVTRYCKVVEEGAVKHLLNDTLGDSLDGGGGGCGC